MIISTNHKAQETQNEHPRLRKKDQKKRKKDLKEQMGGLLGRSTMAFFSLASPWLQKQQGTT